MTILSHQNLPMIHFKHRHFPQKILNQRVLLILRGTLPSVNQTKKHYFLCHRQHLQSLTYYQQIRVTLQYKCTGGQKALHLPLQRKVFPTNLVITLQLANPFNGWIRVERRNFTETSSIVSPNQTEENNNNSQNSATKSFSSTQIDLTTTPLSENSARNENKTFEWCRLCKTKWLLIYLTPFLKKWDFFVVGPHCICQTELFHEWNLLSLFSSLKISNDALFTNNWNAYWFVTEFSTCLFSTSTCKIWSRRIVQTISKFTFTFWTFWWGSARVFFFSWIFWSISPFTISVCKLTVFVFFCGCC